MWIDDYDDDDLSLYCNYNAKTEAEEHYTEPPTEGEEDTPIVHIKGTNCRACDNYNHYMPADFVVDDNKHTCYNCITSPYRWNKNVPKDRVDMLKKFYQHILKKYNHYNFNY